MKTFWEWVSLLNEATSMRFYHGTKIENIPGILQNGIKADAAQRYKAPEQVKIGNQMIKYQGPAARQDKTVYFTKNKPLAARYAVGGLRSEIPAIVEFVISTPRRFKKVQYDPMDRDENAWDQGNEEKPVDMQAVSTLEDAIERLLSNYGIKTNVDLDRIVGNRIHNQGLSALDGFNLYGIILSGLRDKLGNNYRLMQQRIKRDLQTAFNNRLIRSMFQITPSGTLRVRNSYFKTKNQFRWDRDVLPQQIKAVWVRKSDFPNIKGKGKKFGEQEVATWYQDRIELMKDVAQELQFTLPRLIDSMDDENKDDIVNKLKSWATNLKLAEEEHVRDEIENLIDAIENNSDDIQNRVEELAELGAGLEEDAFQNYGGQEVKNIQFWIRLDVVQDSDKIKQILS
jgi:hypothetical protein